MYVEVLDVEIWVFWEVVVLLGHEYTFSEEVLVDLLAISLWNKPAFVSIAVDVALFVLHLHCHESQALFGRSCTMATIVCFVFGEKIACTAAAITN